MAFQSTAGTSSSTSGWPPKGAVRSNSMFLTRAPSRRLVASARVGSASTTARTASTGAFRAFRHLIEGCAVGDRSSSASRKSSWSFSPGRRPTMRIGISVPTSKPDSRIMRSARSRMRTALPISSTKVSPPSESTEAWRTSCTASSTLMKYRVMRGSVTVTGPPSAICRVKVGITLPRLPRTLPKRTEQ